MTDLKLIALDSEDLEIVSAHVQDAVVRTADRRFALLMNRYDWTSDVKRSKGLRKRAAIHFEAVKHAAFAGFDPAAPEGVLNLLAIQFQPTDAPSGIVELSFAGGGTVRLTVDYLEARLADLGAAWAATAKPTHSLD
jgi:hypothetical protein